MRYQLKSDQVFFPISESRIYCYFFCKIKFILLFLFWSMNLLAQVGINSPNPSKAAALDIVDDSRGVAIPQLTRAERTQLKDIAEYAPLPQGLLLYDSDEEMFYYYNPNNSVDGTENWQGLTAFTMKDNRTEIIGGIPMRTVETHKSVRDIRFFSNTTKVFY